MGESLKDKVAIVTGAGRGIGRGVALFLAQEGARVVVNDPGSALDGSGTDQALASQVVEEVRGHGGEATASFESVATMEGGVRIVETAMEQYARLDIVVACAGNLRDQMIYDMTEEEWDDVIRVHLKGTFTVVKHACSLFRQQRSGRIITFGSDVGLRAALSQANYGAAKSGIAGLTKVVARDMGRYGVTANCVAPRGWTRISPALREDGAGPSQFDPGDVAPFVAYLASDLAANVNGQIFKVYGGTVELMSQPRPVRTIFKEGQWTLGELSEICPVQLTAGLHNPSPPAPVKTWRGATLSMGELLKGKVAIVTGAGRGHRAGRGPAFGSGGSKSGGQ